MDKHYIYILKCNDNTLYTGYTTDLDKRLTVHNSGKGAKYTRHRLPVIRVYSERHPTKSAAMQREYAIKQLTRNEKLQLIKEAAHEYTLSSRNADR
ncbi:GIY-YIG nuclease family protein [Macrococcus equipercicus]|uniref:GIY-YIG nuclease family protein n=1 Tax=Macrococcus equipercicus TaxID=69967 RepID=A0A9Q9BT14_9STAP|nr:GIY-YIG nuclease family protein [Macrococcus equipercicus]KAA1036190.1 GIY-YIG nuclease family protein [Macrococcus equipercicus]UTH13749.1 GIY-YIG nuclease family protein [Macrococcus equipercicus]